MKEETRILKGLLESHGLENISFQEGEWLLPDGKLPAIRAYWDIDASENVGQLTIQIVYDLSKMTIEDKFGGFGDRSERLKNAFYNFSLSSLHPFLAIFWDKSTDIVDIRRWNIGNQEYEVYISERVITSVSGEEVELPKNYMEALEDAVKSEPLYDKFHWFGFYYSSLGVVSSTKDNEHWEKGVEAQKALNWKSSSNFYAVREFFIMKRVSKERTPQHWDSCFCELNGEQSLIRINLALKDTLPPDGYKKMGKFTLHLKDLNTSQLLSSLDSSEYKSIKRVEDTIIELVDSIGGAPTAIFTSNRESETLFYFKDDIEIKKEIDTLMRDNFSEYSYSFTIENEENFKRYLTLLHIYIYEKQSKQNLEFLERFEQEGDDITIERGVNHYFIVYSKSAIDKLIQELKGLDFSIENITKEEGYYSIHSKKFHNLDIEFLNPLTWELIDIADRCDGEYSGWGAPIVLNN